jgi:hypothetical protein
VSKHKVILTIQVICPTKSAAEAIAGFVTDLTSTIVKAENWPAKVEAEFFTKAEEGDDKPTAEPEAPRTFNKDLN